MRTLQNSEYLFQNGEVELTLYIGYDTMSYSICEPNEEGVFMGTKTNIERGKLKAALLVEIMNFIDNELTPFAV